MDSKEIPLNEMHPEPSKVKTVQNVALADATEKQRPSPWTKNMLLVGRLCKQLS
jgi:hypothetical protein